MLLLFFLLLGLTTASRLHRVAITQAKPTSTNWAVAHHVYFMYDSIDRLPDWEPYLVIASYPGTSIEAFGRNYRTTSMNNMTGFTVGIASAQHATFPKHMASIAHIQGAEYMNIAKFIRYNASYAFQLNQTYDAMWLLPHHAWQGPFLAERNRIEQQRECPYVWSPRILQHRGKYAYKPNTAGNIGVYETNSGIYKMSYIPLLILNRLARQHPELIQWWETYGLRPISNVEFRKFLLSLRDAIVRPFNASIALADIPSDFKKHDIGTILSHQFTVGLNNIYFEALYMNMSWVHNSPYFRDCGYYYEGFDVEAGALALEHAIRTHDTHLDAYAERSATCLYRHHPLRADNFLAFKVLLDEWIVASPIVLAAQKMQKQNINVMYAVNMVSMVRSWLCNTADMVGVHEKTLIIVDDTSYNELRSMDLRVTLVRDSSVTDNYLPYGTYGYWQLVQRRLHIFGDLIRSGQDIFIVEPDAWWSTDPTLSIESNNADVVGFENSEQVFGFGFLRLRSSPALVRLWAETEWVVDTAMGDVRPPTSPFPLSPMAHEQIAFSRLLQRTNLTTFVLDDCRFPSGRWYSDSNYRYRCPSPSVIQNNYIAGFEQKIQRAKAWHHWFEQDGVCLTQGSKTRHVGITAHDISQNPVQLSTSLVNGHVSLQANMYRYVGYLTCDTWVAGVLSAPNDVEQRNWFRKTQNGSYVFLIGSHSTGGILHSTNLAIDQAHELKTEMSEHQDIVIFGLREQYNQSLTQKVQGFFQVVLQQCPETQFVIKTDHDVWFDFNNVRREVEELDSPVYYGNVLTNQAVYKDTQSKYYDPIFPGDTYPPYVSGWGYVLDRAAVQIVVAQKDTLLRPMEDVHTGLLLRDVVPVMSSAFQGNVANQGYLRGTNAFYNSTTHFGGIGNRLFFWASAVGLAKHSNLTHCVTPNGPDLWLSKVFDMELSQMCTDSTLKKVKSTLHQTHESLDLSIQRVNGMAVESIQLIGYFQSFKYFQEVDIRPQLRFSDSISKAVSLIFAHRIPQARHYVGIHVRRGDALRAGDRRFPPAEYFVQAMAHYRAMLSNDITFVVASDDRDWCRKQSFFRDAHILDDSYSDVLDLALLANSNHTIMSTGTFGWWAAWLANGQTIYYADEFDEQHTNNKIVHDDYYPHHWTPLRPHFYPKDGVTISLCVPVMGKDIRLGYLDRLMRSVKAQTRAPDEVILAISEVDDQACSKVRTVYPTVRVECSKMLRTASQSRNTAWSLATKEYVSFMDADDWMFPNRLEVIAAHTGNASLLVHQFGEKPGHLKAVIRGDAWASVVGAMTRHSNDQLAHGHATVRRDIPVRYKNYEKGEDIFFVNDVVKHVGAEQLLYVQQPLSWYVPRGSQTKQLSKLLRAPTWPLISGDGFRALCKHRCEHMKRCDFATEDVQPGDCVYVAMWDFAAGGTTAYLHAYEKTNVTVDHVLVTHNGDFSAPDGTGWRALEPRPHEWNETFSHLLKKPSLLHWFASNCHWNTPVKPEKLSCIPMGVENRYNRIGRTLTNETYENRAGARRLSLLVDFERHRMKPERAVALNALEGQSFAHVEHYSKHSDWRHAVRQHAFVACPHGHGLDTHRVWETLMLGSWPVVVTSTLDELYKDLPVLVVQHWSQVTETQLKHAALQFKATEMQRDKLFFPYWQRQVQQAQRTSLSIRVGIASIRRSPETLCNTVRSILVNIPSADVFIHRRGPITCSEFSDERVTVKYMPTHPPGVLKQVKDFLYLLEDLDNTTHKHIMLLDDDQEICPHFTRTFRTAQRMHDFTFGHFGKGSSGVVFSPRLLQNLTNYIKTARFQKDCAPRQPHCANIDVIMLHWALKYRRSCTVRPQRMAMIHHGRNSSMKKIMWKDEEQCGGDNEAFMPLTDTPDHLFWTQHCNRASRTTLVTAYFNVPSKFSHDTYKKWMRNLCTIQDPLVIFTSSDMAKWFRDCRQERPTQIRVTTLQSLLVASTASFDVNNIHANLHMIWNEKANWLKMTADEKPFGGSEYYAWIDAGYFRNSLLNDRKIVQSFPNVGSRMFMMSIESLCPVCRGIAGGLFGGTNAAIQRWHSAYYDTLRGANELILEDQTWMLETCLKDPTLCNIVEPIMNRQGIGPWFSHVGYFGN